MIVRESIPRKVDKKSSVLEEEKGTTEDDMVGWYH